MKSKKGSGKGKPSAKRSANDLSPRKTKDVKGGSSATHEMKKALIGNLPR